MTIHLQIVPVVSILAGILILVQPRLLSYIIAIYLIVIGLVGLLSDLAFKKANQHLFSWSLLR